MKDVIIPDIVSGPPISGRGRPDKLVFSKPPDTCGGHSRCAGMRVLENGCFALRDRKGFRGMDLRCVVTMIRVQLEALNRFLGIGQEALRKQSMRVEDVEEIINVIRRENDVHLTEDGNELTREEVFHMVGDLLLETLWANKTMSRYFFGITIDGNETQSFKDLDPKMIERLKNVLMKSYKVLLRAEKTC